MANIDRFTGVNRYLSNFYMCPVKYEGVMYPSSEHAFQAAKTIDKSKRKNILACATPGQAKRRGRLLLLRSDWESQKYIIMVTILLDKFTRNKHLGEKLIATGDAELIEGNAWNDRVWGCTRRTTQSPWIGQNLLGKALMYVRGQLAIAKSEVKDIVTK